jgi:hypothetical protein
MYEIQTFTLCDGFINTWSDDNENPLTFETLQAARKALAAYLWCTRHDSYNGVKRHARDDFKVTEVTA